MSTEPTRAADQPINVVFDGPPSHESGRFVEVELDNGRSVNSGEWVERPDGLWALRITSLPAADQPTEDIAGMARDFSLWLNSTYPPDLSEETVFWRRVGKISEEAGEVRTASGAYWHENPRKPKGPLDHVIAELADCVGAALGAIEHLTGHQGRSLDIATERVRFVCERVGVRTPDPSRPVGAACPQCRGTGGFHAYDCGDGLASPDAPEVGSPWET